MLLLNGSNGIGTGFATKLPCFKKEDILNVVRQVVAGEHPIDDPLPWYHGYKTNHLTRFSQDKWYFRGSFECQTSTKITITEIPIGYSIEGYKEKVLDKLLENKVISKYLVCHVDENTPRFEISLCAPDNAIEETFKLETCLSAACMYFLDSHGCVKRYSSIVDIIRDWYDVKIKYMEKRRLSQILAKKTILDELEIQLKFIRTVVNEQVILYKRTRQDIKQQMLSMGIDESHHERLLSMSLMTVTEERIEKLEKEIRTLHTTINAIQSSTAQSMFMDDLATFDDTKKRTRDGDAMDNEQTKSKKNK
jgi:DNA topoisomerase-2